MRLFRQAYLNWFWGSYTPVYLGVAQAAFDELRRVVHARRPEGYAQPLAYHPDVRRHVAEMSAELEAARLVTYRSAWLSDTEGLTAETTAALYRAKYLVGEAVQPDHPHGADARRRARHLQDFAPRAVVSRRRARAAASAAGGFLPLQHGPLRAWPRCAGDVAADEARAGLTGGPGHRKGLMSTKPASAKRHNQTISRA